MDDLIKQLATFRKGTREEQVYFLAVLKEIGKMMKRTYKLLPEDQKKEFAKSIIDLKKYIDEYDYTDR